MATDETRVLRYHERQELLRLLNLIAGGYTGRGRELLDYVDKLLAARYAEWNAGANDDAGLGRVFAEWVNRDGGYGIDSLRSVAAMAGSDVGAIPALNDVELLIEACERRLAEHTAAKLDEADQAAASGGAVKRPAIYASAIEGTDNTRYVVDIGGQSGEIRLDHPLTLRPGDELGIAVELTGTPIVSPGARPRRAAAYGFDSTAEAAKEGLTPGPDGSAGEPVTDWEYDAIADRIHEHLPYAAVLSRRAVARDVRQWADELIAKRASRPYNPADPDFEDEAKGRLYEPATAPGTYGRYATPAGAIPLLGPTGSASDDLDTLRGEFEADPDTIAGHRAQFDRQAADLLDEETPATRTPAYDFGDARVYFGYGGAIESIGGTAGAVHWLMQRLDELRRLSAEPASACGND